MTAWLRLLPILLILLPATVLLAPVQLAAMRLSKPLARRMPVYWHKTALWLIGVRVHVRGEIPQNRPLLIVANHISWSDIMVLGSVMQLCFIAKADMKSWPGINWLASLQRTVFVERQKPGQALVQANSIAARLNQGDAMVLFPEGTTGDGNRLMAFNSTLFGAVHSAMESAGASHVTVQPVALAYTRLHGMPLGRFHQARAAWPGAIALWPHLFSFVTTGSYDVEVVFCTPGDFSLRTGRKEIARVTREQIRDAFAAAMRMRQP